VNTQHYFHVKSNGKKFKTNLKKFDKIYDNLYKYAKNSKLNFTEFNIHIEKSNIKTEIDCIETHKKKNNLWKIKATSEITLKHVLHLLVSNILYFDLKNKKNTIILNFINLLKGEMIKLKFNLSLNKINDVLKFFVKDDKVVEIKKN